LRGPNDNGGVNIFVLLVMSVGVSNHERRMQNLRKVLPIKS
jgi:hypothetical protein